MSDFVLDTSILIDVLRGHEAAVELVAGLGSVPACSEVTRVEVLRGMRGPERQATEHLLETVEWIVLDEPLARRAGALGRRWRRGHDLSTSDLVIAATVEELEAELLTLNVRHFPMFEALEPPY